MAKKQEKKAKEKEADEEEKQEEEKEAGEEKETKPKAETKETNREQIEGLMQSFREAPPCELAGIPLARVRDYGRHEVRALPDNSRIEELPQPDGDLLFFDSADGRDRFSVAVRPSGTEPKIKFYFFAQAGCDDSDSLGELKTRLDQSLRAVQQAFSAWVRNVLE